MGTGRPVSGGEFANLLRTFQHTAFRLEVQPAYAVSAEREDLDLYLAGTPRRPDEADWFRPWLDQVRQLTAQGKRISRVRVQSEPPTGYQKWERWVGAWNIAAGEDIRYMPRSTAERIGLPLTADWWLLDDTRLILMQFTGTGEIAGRELVTDAAAVAPYRTWRDLAVSHATAEQTAAA
jgi:hypothetical protein